MRRFIRSKLRQKHDAAEQKANVSFNDTSDKAPYAYEPLDPTTPQIRLISLHGDEQTEAHHPVACFLSTFNF